MVFTLEMCTHFALSENKRFQPFEGFDPEVKWILVLADRCLVLVPISSVQSSGVGDGCFATKEQLFCLELKCRLSVLGDWILRQQGPVFGARWMAPPGEGYHLGNWSQTTRTSLGSMVGGSNWMGYHLGDWSLRQQGLVLRAWYVAPPGESYH